MRVGSTPLCNPTTSESYLSIDNNSCFTQAVNSFYLLLNLVVSRPVPSYLAIAAMGKAFNTLLSFLQQQPCPQATCPSATDPANQGNPCNPNAYALYTLLNSTINIQWDGSNITLADLIMKSQSDRVSAQYIRLTNGVDFKTDYAQSLLPWISLTSSAKIPAALFFACDTVHDVITPISSALASYNSATFQSAYDSAITELQQAINSFNNIVLSQGKFVANLDGAYMALYYYLNSDLNGDLDSIFTLSKVLNASDSLNWALVLLGENNQASGESGLIGEFSALVNSCLNMEFPQICPPSCGSAYCWYDSAQGGWNVNGDPSQGCGY